ncbi:MAG: HAD family hydrolase [Christensenellaceae bacterium]|jgi:FMN phosphatase YigB (HAD superfamily)|nr:HAD family hydrolase [Christensenellaceae bacterium]
MIDTIFFDVGNTLRVVVKDEAFASAAEAELMRLVGAAEPHDVFFEKLEKNWHAYRKASKTGLLDASEMELWSQHLLPDYPIDLICSVAGRLTRLWRDHDGRRVARPDVKDTLIELDRRGYTMGIIANTITETEIPDWMVEDGVARYFKTVILSSKVRLRKPDPAIYYLAARAIGKAPAACAYIGDNPIRDVQGTRDSGFGMMIRIDEPATLVNEPQEITLHPDYTITAIGQLLDIFPPLAK